jgi:hypothetical protein
MTLPFSKAFSHSPLCSVPKGLLSTPHSQLVVWLPVSLKEEAGELIHITSLDFFAFCGYTHSIFLCWPFPPLGTLRCLVFPISLLFLYLQFPCMSLLLALYTLSFFLANKMKQNTPSLTKTTA